MSTDLKRIALNGPTMGTRWSALFHAPGTLDTHLLKTELQSAVEEVDTQMSTWKPDSALMQLNKAPENEWLNIPQPLLGVVETGMKIGALSSGAFDIGLGDAVSAWGFASKELDPQSIRTALSKERKPAHKALIIDKARQKIRKASSISLDLSGIAKGFGVDRLAETLVEFGISSALVGIDGEMRAMGTQPDGAPWVIAVEQPDRDQRAPFSILCLEDASVATSGDYRHWVDVGTDSFSHTMDPKRGGPLSKSPASVTVIARTCMEADAFATVLMVMGIEAGSEFAKSQGLNALFLMRDAAGNIQQRPVGPLFCHEVTPAE